MAAKKEPEKEPPKKRKRKPPSTPEGRELRNVSLATDLAEEQLANGTASAQVISHYIKQGSQREILEQERISNENKLLKAKVEQLESGARIEELYEKAIDAMRVYNGSEEEYEEEEYEDD